MKLRNIIIVLGILVLGFSSCEKKSDIELGPVYPMAGEWWVTARFDDGTGTIDDHYGVGYFYLLTSNTASFSSSELLVDDDGNFWNFKVKTNLNLEGRAFSVADGEDLNYALADPPPDPYPTVTITNGQVIIDGGTSTDGNQTDSIYMEVTYSDDTNGFTYIISGHKRTGFLEDEH